ncbi:MAG: TIGR01777 family oxidoreductase [Planctomycetota bacterium]
MKVAVTGSTGLVGAALVSALRERGDEVVCLVRREARGDDEVAWSPEKGVLEPPKLEGVDAVIHLAGENIAAKRWSDQQKQRIRDSRVVGTAKLVESLTGLVDRPKVFLSASAIGFYGQSGSERVDEASGAGTGFLPEVCRAWEDASKPLAEAGTRVAHLRFGVILSPGGGALAKMLLPFKLGLGGNVGSGAQGMSWISLRDAVGATLHVLDQDLSGPVNMVAPTACSNADFTRSLGRALHRPTILPMPAFAARLAFGELADDLLLASLWVEPKALLGSGYRFQDSEVEGALSHLLGSKAA